MQPSHWTTCAALAALSLLAVPAVAQADTSGTLFEQPFFTSTSALNGQDGWLNTGGYDAAIVSNSGSAADAFGQQSLRISNARTSGAFGDQTFSSPLTDGAGETTSVTGGQAGGERQPHFDTTFRFLSTTPAAEQPGLAVTISPDTGNGGRMSFLRLRTRRRGSRSTSSTCPRRRPTPGTWTSAKPRSRKRSRARPAQRPALDRFRPRGEQRRGQGLRRRPTPLHRLLVGELLPPRHRERPGHPVPVVDQLMLRVSSNPAHPELDGKGFLIDDVSSRSYGGQGGPRSHRPAGPTGPTGPAGSSGSQASTARSPRAASSALRAGGTDRRDGHTAPTARRSASASSRRG